MRPERLEVYWDVIRDGMSYKETAERHGVNPGQVWKVCKTSVISRPVGRPAAFDEFRNNEIKMRFLMNSVREI